MTNYNERLEEIFNNLYIWDSSAEGAVKIEASLNEAKQAITSLIKELAAEAKPDWHEHEKSAECFCFTEATEKFEQNLLKELEDK